MKLRNLIKTQGPNDGTRTLKESLLVPELIKALDDLKRAKFTGVLIGAAALSFYVKPRMTQDLDALFLNFADIPTKITGFKRTRDHAFVHKKTGVELEVLDAEFLKTSPQLVQQVIDTSSVQQGIRVASPSGLVAMKLGRFSRQDQADIVNLIKNTQVDISGFALDAKQIEAFKALEQEANTEPE